MDTATIPTAIIKEKKVSGIADRALEKAAELSTANVEIASE